MNLLLTGSSGFVGSNLLNELRMINDSFENIYLITNKEISGYICLNYSNYNIDKSLFKNIKKIDVIIHIGAYTPKSNNERNLINSCNSNITYTLGLIESLPNLPQKFIYVSTTDIYGSDEVIDENSKIQPISLYAYSKLYCEEMLKIWAEENNVCLQILRLGHIYGIGEEKYKKIIPTIINKIIYNIEIDLFSNGTEKRSFLNIKDCCKLILNSMKLEEFVGPINIVSSMNVSLLNLIDLLFEISQKTVGVKCIDKSFEARDILYNNEKMIKYLGNETISLKQGLREEYEYCYKKEIIGGRHSELFR